MMPNTHRMMTGFRQERCKAFLPFDSPLRVSLFPYVSHSPYLPFTPLPFGCFKLGIAVCTHET